MVQVARGVLGGRFRWYNGRGEVPATPSAHPPPPPPCSETPSPDSLLVNGRCRVSISVLVWSWGCLVVSESHGVPLAVGVSKWHFHLPPLPPCLRTIGDGHVPRHSIYILHFMSHS
jgi:hypothetical protein